MTRLPTSTIAALSVVGLVALAAVYAGGAAALGWAAAGVATSLIWRHRTTVFPGDEFDGLPDDGVWRAPAWRAGTECRRWRDGLDGDRHPNGDAWRWSDDLNAPFDSGPASHEQEM